MKSLAPAGWVAAAILALASALLFQMYREAESERQALVSTYEALEVRVEELSAQNEQLARTIDTLSQQLVQARQDVADLQALAGELMRETGADPQEDP